MINIELVATNNNFSLKIADQGIGIPPAYKDKIFEKFFRVPSGNQHNVKGYGLGGNGEKPVEDKKEAVKMRKYIFNSGRQVLKDNGDEKKLSFCENELLKLLYENKDRIVDRRIF